VSLLFAHHKILAVSILPPRCLEWSEFLKLCNINFGVVYKVGNMAETNLKIDIRWLTLKTCLLPHPRGHVEVKFHEFVITQLLGEIEN